MSNLPVYSPALEQILDRAFLCLPPQVLVVEVLACMNRGVGSQCKFGEREGSDRDPGGAIGRTSYVLVKDNRQLVGIFTERDVVRLSAAKHSLEDLTLGEVMSQSVVCFNQGEYRDIFGLLSLMRQHSVRHLPILDDGGEVIGVVTRERLREVLQPANLLRLRQVGEVMVESVIHAPPHTSVQKIAQLMAQHRVSCVAIAQPDAAGMLQPLGIITERDLVQFQLFALDLELLEAQGVMSGPLLTVSPENSLWEAHQQMQQYRVRRLVVTGSGGELLGIVTQSSVLRSLDPMEMYRIIQVLQEEVCQLKREKVQLLEHHQRALATEVQARDKLEQQWQRDRRQAQMSLRESEAQFRLLAENSTDIIARLRVDGTLLYVSPACTRVLGYQPSELLGRSAIEFLHPDDLPAFTSGKGLACQIPDRGIYTFRVRHRQGYYLWLESTARSLRNSAEGAIAEIQSTSRDVTDRVQAEQQLQKALHELEFQKFALDRAAIVAITDPQGRITYANDKFCQLSEYSRAELIGQTHRLVNSGYHDTAFFQQMWATISSGRVWQGEVRNKSKTGQVYWVDTTIVPFMDHTGKPFQYLAIRIDITERKKAEEALRESERRFRSLFEAAPDFIYLVDINGIILQANPAAFAQSGYSESEVIGHRLDRFFTPNSQGCFAAEFPILLQGGTTRQEVEVIRKDGRVAIMDCSGSVVRDEEGNFTYLMVIQRDISDRKLVEKYLQSSNHLLQGISAAQSEFIAQKNKPTLFAQLLDNLLQITDSEYGAIAEVFPTGAGDYECDRAYLKTRHSPELKTLEIRENNLDESRDYNRALTALLQSVIATEKPIIYPRNKAKTCPINCQANSGEKPAIHAFLGVPFYLGNRLVGAIAIANHSEGYDMQMVEYLQPFLSTCANIIEAYRNDLRRQEAEAALKQKLAAVEAASDGIAVLTERGEYLYLNTAHVRLFGYDSAAELLGKNWQNLYDAEEISRFEREVFPILGASGHWRGEATAKKRDGSIFSEEVSLTLIEGVGLVCVCRDITDRKQAEAALKQRDRYLVALVEVQRQLLAAPVNRDLYQLILSILGPISQASRIYVFENHRDANGNPISSQKAEWCAPGISPQIDNPDLQNFSYRDMGCSRWEEILSQGEIIQGNVADFPPSERAVLEPQDIKSILILPLMVQGEFFGLIGFDNCVEVREWTSLEIGILTSAAAAIALGKERQLTEQAWQQAKDQLQAVLDAVPGLVSWISSDLYYLGVNQQLAAAFHQGSETIVGQAVGFRDRNTQFAEFIANFFNSPNTSDRATINVDIEGQSSHYLIAAQKYQQGKACVSVGIDISDRLQAEEKIKASLKEKEILLKEIHHRVKNNLYVVSSLLEMQADILENPQLTKLLAESQHRISSMALIHEKLYQSTDLGQIDLGEYLADLATNLFESYTINEERIQLCLETEPILVNIETAGPCGLIVNELVTNAMKHAFPDGIQGRVRVKCHQDSSGSIHLIVEDNGVGFPEGLDFRKTTSMGLQLVDTLTDQLEGTLELNRQAGTTFHVRFFELNYSQRF
ncbi:PAS domain S-box protein [Phormidium sp. CCY1219]|uniref:PAS domain S-box protein n=1 Tax=Phormidium sp. CCY1219 TaxID=2886104 RepID=UPI002D1F203D|nr:PAS domain S-box protein [Phormidium sp. CCY1219]MEB3827762.1 PAS domain S-box protein [Phormidium sp. CCY1219]